MRNYLAVWSFRLPDGRRQEITMTFWANKLSDARHVASTWFNRAEPTLAPCEWSIADVTADWDNG